MSDASALPEVYLRPGEVFLAHEPTVIATILGSCVGVTFWSARLGVGALCHAILPRRPAQSPREPESTRESARESAREPSPGHHYVDFCIRDLSRVFGTLGALPQEIQVKLFGGADVLFVRNAESRPTVGRLNCETAIAVLREEGYDVAAASLGDTFGRKIRFNTGSGDVLLRRLV